MLLSFDDERCIAIILYLLSLGLMSGLGLAISATKFELRSLFMKGDINE